MEKPDKTSEPSMEEILASIRKIIAEEPIGSRPGPEPEPRGPALAGPESSSKPSDLSGRPSLALPPRDEHTPNRPPFSADDPLADLTDDPLPRFPTAPGRQDPAPSPSARTGVPSEDNQRPSWLFSRPGSSPVQPVPQSGADGSRSAGLMGQLDAIRPLPQSGVSGADSLAPKPSGAQRVVTPDTLFDRQKGAERPAVGGVTPLPGHTPDLMQPEARTSALDAGGAASQDIERQASAGAESGDNRSEQGYQQPKLAPLSDSKPQPGSAAAAERPRQGQQLTEAPASDKSQVAADGLVRTPASPLASLAQGLAAVGGKLDAGKAEAASAAKASPAADRAAVRTLEDTVAELLRPMLRDWLDANMPRIVEKALKDELASREDGAKPSEK